MYKIENNSKNKPDIRESNKEKRESEPRVNNITMKTFKEQYGKLSSKQQEKWSSADMNLQALLTLDLTKMYSVKDLENKITLDDALQLLFAARYE